jgi:Xaa-Pro aminopeptidase
MARAKKSTGAILVVAKGEETPDLVYATGFSAPDPVVFLQTPDARYLVVPRLELGRAKRTCRDATVLIPEDLKLTGPHVREPTRWALAVLRRAGVRRIVVAAEFPHGTARFLERCGIRVFVARGPLFPKRATKTARELAQIRQSQQAAVIAMRAAIALIARADVGPGRELRIRGEPLTSEQVKRRIAESLLDQRCFAGEIIVAGGEQGADPHEQGHGVLRAGEPIVLDIFPRHLDHGYWGDLSRTVVRGEPSRAQRRQYLAVKAAQAAALDRIKPGVRCASVHAAAEAEFRRRGYETKMANGRAVGFIHGTGHGVGLAIHEPPAISRAEGRLRVGHVITVEPGLYYPALGGVRIEDTVVVTRTGWRYLVPCEKRFEV